MLPVAGVPGAEVFCVVAALGRRSSGVDPVIIKESTMAKHPSHVEV